MKKIWIKFCPKCGSKDIDEVILVIGGKMGLYECKNCKFRGSIFPEKNIKLKKLKRKK